MQFMDFQGPRFTLQIPTDWLITSSPRFQAMFLAPGSGYAVRPNMVVTLRAVEEDVTPPAIAESAAETQAQTYADYQGIDESELLDSYGNPIGYVRSYSWLEPDQNVRVIQTQAYYVADPVLYTLTATRPASIANGGEYDSVFQHMIETFQVAIPTN